MAAHVGAAADCVALQDPLDLGMNGETLLDRWIFGRDIAVTDVWANGAHVVESGRHMQRETIMRRAAQILRRILE
jgi:formimidoylglutamate deiminase